jgi:hypothetical protein
VINFSLNCKETARIISEGLDHFLPLHKRVLIRIHLAACVTCGYFQRQVKSLTQLLCHCRDSEHLSYGPCLPEATKQRIKDLLRTQKG